MSTIIYKVWFGDIVAKEAERVSEKSVWVPRRENPRGSYWSWHDTYEDARRELVGQLKSERNNLKAALGVIETKLFGLCSKR